MIFTLITLYVFIHFFHFFFVHFFSDLKEYSQNVYNIVKLLYEKINQARKKVNEVQNFIETWNKCPVFVRETPSGIVKFEMFMTPRMNQQIHKINESSVMMNRIMEVSIPFIKKCYF